MPLVREKESGLPALSVCFVKGRMPLVRWERGVRASSPERVLGKGRMPLVRWERGVRASSPERLLCQGLDALGPVGKEESGLPALILELFVSDSV
jgi:hypothetical protein